MESILSQETQDQVNLYFVLPKNTSESTCSEKLASSYQACLDVGFPSQWIKEQDVLQMQPVKQDVFICDPFEGPAFDHLSSGKFKCVRILGPPCLLACLSRSEPVPELPYPLYTAAMRGMVITSTGFQKPEKSRLQRLIRQMSGVYSSDFHEGVTHLVAGVVASPKYQVAVCREVAVMRAGWVDRVWETSRQQTVQATDPQFADLSCPPFQGLYICVSQLGRRDKEAIKRLIEANGGSYMTQLECEKTNVLISPSMEGEKVTFARRWQIPCVVPDWLYDSVERGSCLAMEQYNTFDKAKLSSTPTKNHTMAYGELADLTVSTIMGANESVAQPVNETTMNETAAFAVPSMAPTATTPHEDLAELDRIDIQEVAKAGQFLDGCKIHTVGFDCGREEKLRRLLNPSGAVRLSQLLPSVTHVVVGGGGGVPDALLSAADWRPHVVTVRWLVASCRAGRPLPEAEYAVPGAGPAERPPPPDGAQDETVLPGPPADQTTVQAANDTTLDGTQTLFGGLPFYFSSSLDEQTVREASQILEEHGGRRVSARPDARFALVPLVHPEPEPEPEPDAVVTIAYLQHCVETDKLLEPEYFHRPIRTSGHDILTGCVIGISSYSGRERQYLALLAESMGAEFQEVFARRDNPAKHALASTHLVCQAAEGHKYTAARRWGLPAVSREWLRACAAAGRRLSPDPFAVEGGGGDSTLRSATCSAVSVPSGTAAPPAAADAAGGGGGGGTGGSGGLGAAGCGGGGGGGGGGAVPWFMVPPVDVTPVRPPRLPAADTVTPQTPAGGPPPASSRSAWKRYVEAMEETPESKRRRVSTPMSQLVIQFFKGLTKGDGSGKEDLDSSSQASPAINSKAVNAELQSEAAAAVSGTPAAVPAQKRARTAATPRQDGGPATPSAAGGPAQKRGRVTPQSGQPTQRGSADEENCSSPPAPDAASDVTRQLAELNRLVSRRSGGLSASAERRIPSLAEPPPPPAAGTETESAPHGAELNSQGTAVTWDDPEERQARNNLMSEEPGHQDSENLAAPGGGSGQKPPPSRPVLLFSGMEPSERSRYAALAERLGGAVLDAPTLQPAATHLVTYRPNRSEKHLAAVASGRWLLQPRYLDACQQAGHFLPEEAFEWGNPECLQSSGLAKDSTEYKLSSAAYRWRRKILEEGIPGAFHAMVAVLFTAGERSRAFERLVTAGGGRVVSPDHLRRPDTDVTHVFIEPTRADRRQLTPQLMAELARRRLPCLQPVYLNECLTAVSPPRPEDWLLDEYRRLVAGT